MRHKTGATPVGDVDACRARFSRGVPWSVLALCWVLAGSLPAGTVPHHPDLAYINTSFENASPLYWETDPNGLVHVYLVYDQERNSPNRANGHWFFQLQTVPGAELTVVNSGRRAAHGLAASSGSNIKTHPSGGPPPFQRLLRKSNCCQP